MSDARYPLYKISVLPDGTQVVTKVCDDPKGCKIEGRIEDRPIMTYEHGKADADAPVTWQSDHPDWTTVYVTIGRDDDGDIVIPVEGTAHAESICRAFRLAKLAEDAAKFVESEADRPSDYDSPEDRINNTAKDWLRRYRAAKGES